MKFSVTSFFILLSVKLLAQSGLFTNGSNYGPCENYLNAMGYSYSFADLAKDTLFYEAQPGRPGAVFIQSKKRLINAEFYDKNGTPVSKGNFKDGNGKLIIESYRKDYKKQFIYSFSDGLLNDTSFEMINGKIIHMCIYKNNVLIKDDSRRMNRHIINYDENGMLHDSTFSYGSPNPYPWSHYAYIGKLYQVSVFEHGSLKEMIFYKQNGSIKSKTSYKVVKVAVKKKNKRCLF